jgi:serine/threonine protein kinase
MSEPIILGEGTFGTVFKPAIPCDLPLDLTNKISKVMETKTAEAELKEFDKIEGLEPYHIGKPVMCEISQENFDKYVVAQSSNIIAVNGPDARNYRMLQYNYGGRDLSIFVVDMKRLPPEIISIFWRETIRLWEGIREFMRRGLSHGDIKPQNIVFNYETHDLKYIDFGNMARISELIAGIKQREFFWNLPLELSIESSPDVEKTLTRNKTFLEYTENKTNPTLAVMIPKPGSTAKKIPKIINPSLLTSISLSAMAGFGFKTSNERSIITTDTYGLAGTLCFVANRMYDEKMITSEAYTTLYGFFSKYFDPNVGTRSGTDIEASVHEYRDILSRLGFGVAATPMIEEAATPAVEKRRSRSRSRDRKTQGRRSRSRDRKTQVEEKSRSRSRSRDRKTQGRSSPKRKQTRSRKDKTP